MSEKFVARTENPQMDSNARTLETYENRDQEYIDRTEHDVPQYVQEWIDLSLKGLSTEARILEYGSGPGRDAAYIEEKGYSVQRSDATRKFLKRLHDQGYEARELNLLSDRIDDQYDFILANAVLLHFTHDQTAEVVRNTFDALDETGRFAFTLVQGEGDKWSDSKLGEPRYFCYWQNDQVEKLLTDTGFSRVDFVDTEAGADTGWIRVVAYK